MRAEHAEFNENHWKRAEKNGKPAYICLVCRDGRLRAPYNIKRHETTQQHEANLRVFEPSPVEPTHETEGRPLTPTAAWLRDAIRALDEPGSPTRLPPVRDAARSQAGASEPGHAE